MRLLQHALIGLSLALSVSTLSAHETLPKNWCVDPATQPVIVSRFQFSPQQLKTLASQVPDPLSVSCDPGCSHGIVDSVRDQWYEADHISRAYCAAPNTSQSLRRSSHSVTAMPFVTSPEAFNDPQNHHDAYDFSQGLSGACVVCVAVPPSDPPLDGL
jgi:hypothetical protein